MLLCTGEIDIGAVAAEETGIGIVALFAFQFGADADGGDDDVGSASGGEGFVFEIGREPEQASKGFAEAAEIFEFDLVGVAGLEVDGNSEGAFAALAVEGPVVDDELVIEVKAEAAVGGGAKAVVAIDGSGEGARPTDGIVFDGDARSGRDVVPEEVDVGIDAGEDGLAGEIGIEEKFGVDAVLRARLSAGALS